MQRHIRKTNVVEKLVLNKLFWAIMVTLLFAYPIVKSVSRRLPNALPVLGEVPRFSFYDETGNTFGSSELKGKVYLAHFMSVDCTGICDLSLKEMQKVQHRMRGVIDRAAIVSFSIHPDADTTEKRFALARSLNANPVVWRFLAGPMDETQKLIVEGFKLAKGQSQPVTNMDEAVKANHLVLVDHDGKIRGYYPLIKDGVNRLMIDIGLLINRKKES